MALPVFRFKKFKVAQDGAAHPVGTDAVLLGAWTDLKNSRRFLDIGTGTGVIALMLAQRLEEQAVESVHQPGAWSGVGVEIHPPSAALARENVAESLWKDQLKIWEGPLQEFTKTAEERFDLIVSNPPFFSEKTISPNKTRSLGRHTESLPPEDLLLAVRHLLTPGGRFCIVLPEREARLFCENAVTHGLYWTRITSVCSRPGKPIERLLLQFEKRPFGMEQETICLFEGQKGERYSDAFKALTQDFYLAG